MLTVVSFAIFASTESSVAARAQIRLIDLADYFLTLAARV
ncbi:hypothetical protein HCH_00716 [Hahella chejuensis KCTC 2396]|uniref:Uncharacterized protein n=1 Tax=Hahella chejuensis (strain KCTC 2396) TaxID=349521 RepID=Q2SP10_HAHCH|nr:hypothetical protein HCH_00716 [Hahella chejuensis KCTC 2396]